MGIDEAGRGPVLGPMVYGCLYCARSYLDTLATLRFADSKTSKEEKREDLFEYLKAEEAIGWTVDVIDPRELSAKMLKKEKINLNEISRSSAMGLVSTILNRGVLLTEWEIQKNTELDYLKSFQTSDLWLQRKLIGFT